MKDQTRNLNPTAPAILAMALCGAAYAAQRGGSMDFWDSLPTAKQKTFTDLAERVRAAPMTEDR